MHSCRPPARIDIRIRVMTPSRHFSSGCLLWSRMSISNLLYQSTTPCEVDGCVSQSTAGVLSAAGGESTRSEDINAKAGSRARIRHQSRTRGGFAGRALLTAPCDVSITSLRDPGRAKALRASEERGAETPNDLVSSSGLVTDEVRYSLPSFGWRNRHARYSEEHIALAKRG